MSIRSEGWHSLAADDYYHVMSSVCLKTNQ